MSSKDLNGNIMGWMTKEGYYGRSQRRWFVLKQEGLIYYINNEADCPKKGVIPLTNCKAVGVALNKDKKPQFVIDNKERTWVLEPDVDDLYQWVKSFIAMRLMDKKDPLVVHIISNDEFRLKSSLHSIEAMGKDDKNKKRITPLNILNTGLGEDKKGEEELTPSSNSVDKTEDVVEVTHKSSSYSSPLYEGYCIRIHFGDGCKPLLVSNVKIEMTTKELKFLVWKAINNRLMHTLDTGSLFPEHEVARRDSKTKFDPSLPLPSPRIGKQTSRRKSSVAQKCTVEGCITLHHREDGLCPLHYSEQAKMEKSMNVLGIDGVPPLPFPSLSEKSKKLLDVEETVNANSSMKVKKFFGFAEDARHLYGCTCNTTISTSSDLYAFKCMKSNTFLIDDDKTLAYYDILLEKDPLNFKLIHCSELPTDRLEIVYFNSIERFDHTGKKYISYAAKMQHGPLEWVIDHRYSEFDAFHEKIKEEFGSKHDLPKFPPKHIMEKHTPEFIKQRCDQLLVYLKALLCMDDEIILSTLLLSFLGMLSTVRNDIAEKGKDWKILHISKVREMIGVGDVILFKSKNTASSLQRTVTGSDWDHVGIVVGQTSLMLLEATGVGVETYDLLGRLRAYSVGFSQYIAIRKLNWTVTPEAKKRLHEFVISVVGKPYRITAGKILNRQSVARRASVERDDSSKSGFFCSELVVSALKALGVVKQETFSSYFWPVMFASGGSIEEYLVEGASFSQENLVDFTNIPVSRARSSMASPRSSAGSSFHT